MILDLESPSEEIGNPAVARPGSALGPRGESVQTPCPVRRDPGSDEGADERELADEESRPMGATSAPGELTIVQAAEVSERLWQRSPLAFLGLCASCRERGMTLLERIQQRAKELTNV